MAAIGLVLAGPPPDAEAAHPCAPPEFRMVLVGPAYVGRLATFRFEGSTPRRIDWGDGSTSWRRRIADVRLRHRFRRAGDLRVTVVQPGLQCCSSDHQSCSTSDVTRTVRVRVRRIDG